VLRQKGVFFENDVAGGDILKAKDFVGGDFECMSRWRVLRPRMLMEVQI
jgi:hypothetical protein